MTSKRSFAHIIAICLTVPVTASAAEITLFEGSNFQGRSITFNGEATNLDPIGFNDRAASIIVRDGVWEGCVDAYFQGGCAQFRPGEYPQLDRRFNQSISSLRVVGGQPGYGGQRYPDAAYNGRNGYHDDYYDRNRVDGHDRGYYGYPYRDHGQ